MAIRSRRILVVAMLVPLLALWPAGNGAARATGGVVGPKAYYLALGDSLAYGLQPNLHNNAGYAQDFYANLQPRGTQHLIDMGCSGETTATMINGGCPDRVPFPPHYPYVGAQLTAALSFIQHHRGQISPLTLDIGANDFIPHINVNTCTVSAFTPTIQQFETNFTSILSQLHTALGTSGDLVTMTYYDPYQNACPNLIPLVQYFNGKLASLAQRYGALVAPVFTAFGGPAVPNPNICTYTWYCRVHTYPSCLVNADLCIHATTEGYAVMAKAFETTVGY